MSHKPKEMKMATLVELPRSIQERILYYLQTDNFKAAKQLRDDYLVYNDGNNANEGQDD